MANRQAGLDGNLPKFLKEKGTFLREGTVNKKIRPKLDFDKKDPIDVALYVYVKTCLSKQINIFIKLNLIFTSKARTNLHVSKQICNVLFNYSNGPVRNILGKFFYFGRESRYLWQILPSHCCQIILMSTKIRAIFSI